MNLIWHAVAGLALRHGRRLSPRDLAASSAILPKNVEPEAAALALQAFGFDVKVFHIGKLSEFGNAFVLLRLRSTAWVLYLGRREQHVELHEYSESTLNEHGENIPVSRWTWEKLQAEHDGLVISATPLINFDTQAGSTGNELTASMTTYVNHWFWAVFYRLRSYYGDCVTAAILINLLTLAGSIFIMNVYDRIIPNSALHSLWVLAIGVMLASILELGLRTLRTHVLDEAGKRADLSLSAAIFRQVLNLQPKDRPSSSGQFASQLREFESVRDFVSSTTLVTLTDLPFVFLFFAVVIFIGGHIIWVPVFAAILIIAIGFISQSLIRQSVERYQYENTQKHAFLIEALERLETIEALGARASIQGRWECLSAITARSSMSSRFVLSLTLNISQFLQQISSTVLIIMGVYLILSGQLTSGALIGCSILAGRALSPLGQVAALMARWQHTRAAFDAVDKLMHLAQRNDPHQTYVHINEAEGELALENVHFSYPRSEKKVLQIGHLTLRRDEVTAVMGPVGSGKSTLLRVLAGLHFPSEGQVLLNGLDVRQISAADWRAQIAWVSQDAVLFRGTLRENLLISAPQVSDTYFIHILKICGLETLIAQHPQGLDMPLGEAGQALSGGQRQMVVLARALLANCPILLLDEPTSAFDMPGEQALLQRLKPEFAGRMVMIATHRPGPLEISERLIILDRGQVTADGPRDVILQAIREGQITRQSVVQGKKS